MKTGLPILLLFFVFKSFAQNKIIDSLQQKLKKYPEKTVYTAGDSTRAYTLNELSTQYELISDYPTAKKLADAAFSLSEKINYKRGKASALNIIGIIYYDQGNYPMALKMHMAALKIRETEGDKNRIASSHSNIGTAYFGLGNYPEAVKEYFAALKTGEEIGDKKIVSYAHHNIGNVYSSQGNNQNALKEFFAGLKMFEEMGDKHAMASSLLNIAGIYSDMRSYDKALEYLLACKKIAAQTDNRRLLPQIHNNMGLVYDHQGKYENALKEYFASLMEAREMDNKETMTEAYLNIGATKLKTNNAAEAKRWYLKGLIQSKEIGYIDAIRHSYDGLTEADSALGNYKDAFENYKIYIAYRDSLFNEENTKKTVQTQMQFEFDKKESATKAEQEKKDAIAQEEIKRQSNIRNSTFAGLAIVLIFSIVVYRQRNKIGREKKRSDQLVLDKEMLIKEVHHRVKNNLEVISSLLELQSEGIADSRAKAAVMEGQSRVQSIALIHHKLYRNDDVSAVEFKNFVNDLYKQVASVFKKPGTEIEFQVTGNETQISIVDAVPLGLIVNELLTNTFKYAMQKEKLNSISIHLESSNSKLNTLIYKDNGPGLPLDFDIQKSTSLGMKVIQLLTKQLGGTLKFYTDNGSVFEIPFKNNSKN